MSNLRYFPFFFISLAATVFPHCAGQVPPAGGPVDTIPPIIKKTVPDTNAVRVQTSSVELEFSKYVDRRSVEESIFISPYAGQPEFDWSGTSVTVKFAEALRKSTTYVVNVGTDVVDLRARNRMAAGFTLAFSTGDSIDQGCIAGRVFDEKAEGIMIFAYALQTINPDTLDPSRLKPDYVTQTGKEGRFLLSHISLGTYRLFAVRDEYRNLLYDKEIDQFGVAQADIVLTPHQERYEDVWFRMSKEDTTRPFLTSAVAFDRRHILVRFSEPLDSLTFRHAVVSIRDTLTARDIPVLVANLDRSNPAAAGIVTGMLLDGASVYRAHVADVADRAGNRIDTLHSSYVFPGTSRPDTLRPTVIVRAMTDSTRGVPPDQPLEIHFSEPVQQSMSEHAVWLSDAAQRTAETTLRWLDATDACLVPKAQLRDNAWYQVRVVMDSIRDFDGNGYKDSSFTLHFQTLDFRTTGTIEGSVEDVSKGGRKGPIFLTATSIDVQLPRSRTIELAAPGRFKVEHVPEGRYVVNAFIDTDSSRSYSYGRPHPFRASERFAASPDTLTVRARWAVEGVVAMFR